jgi:hypothetical protein
VAPSLGAKSVERRPGRIANKPHILDFEELFYPLKDYNKTLKCSQKYSYGLIILGVGFRRFLTELRGARAWRVWGQFLRCRNFFVAAHHG